MVAKMVWLPTFINMFSFVLAEERKSMRRRVNDDKNFHSFINFWLNYPIYAVFQQGYF